MSKLVYKGDGPQNEDLLTIGFLKDRFKVYLQSKVDETIVHTDKHAHVWPDFINSLSKEGFEQIENVGKGSNFLGTFDSVIQGRLKVWMEHFRAFFLSW